jgi:hypothetical protein
MNSKENRRILAGVLFAVSFIGLPLTASAGQDSDDIHLKVRLTQVNNSGITGTAVLNISEDGLIGKVRADHLVPGHAYTVWLFYQEGDDVGGPGRFDSAVAENDDTTFRGRVRGLSVTSGAIVKLVVFDHPDLGQTNVTRADNLLTPNGGSSVAQAVFQIP